MMCTPADSALSPGFSNRSAPISKIFPALFQAFATSPCVCLQAPPGVGKTTRVPPALLEHDGKGVLMLEPRRLAARAAARYMAGLFDEPVGATVGYRVRMDTRVSAQTRITMVTEGVLTRLLRNNPELPDIGWLIFDEFHERHLQGDVGLALALECQETLREAHDPLRILVMSATLDVEPLARLLGDCPVIRAESALWPVDTRYLPPRPQERPETHVLRAVRDIVREQTGSVLVFLPGEGEIRRVESGLTADPPLPADVSVHPLYGDLQPEAQDAALAPTAPGQRKVVLATSIAESSLTIEGVHVVVDSGLSRSPRFDPGTGMGRLVTGRVALSSADQRRGRAGRTSPGICMRLWNQEDEAGFRPVPRPEILDADLADLRLELALWGMERRHLRWLDPPPDEAWEQASSLLVMLEALEPDGTGSAEKTLCTPHGRAMADLPVHPRVAHMLLRSVTTDAPSVVTACGLAALMGERDPLRSTGHTVDARLRLEWLRRGEGQARRVRDLAQRLAKLLSGDKRQAGRNFRRENSLCNLDPELAGLLLALAYPDRVAQRRPGTNRGQFLLANGRGGWLDTTDPLADEAFLAVGEVDGKGPNCRIFQAAPLTEADVRALFGGQIRTVQRVFWDDREEAVCAREQEVCAALVLRDVPQKLPNPERLGAAQATGFRALGLAALPWTPELLQWRARVQFLRRLGHADLFPDLSDAALTATLEVWLTPFAGGVTRRTQWRTLPLREALTTLFPQDRLYTALQTLDKEAPKCLLVPSGSHIRLEYPDSLLAASPEENETAPPSPVLAVKLQELFGLERTPTAGGVPVQIHLLSPAGRPLQVTSDLAGFWRSSYQAVRAEMRGRYPRHPWPENPLDATPTRRANPRK